MTLRMRNDNILVQVEPPPEASRSGLVVLPQQQARSPIQAVPARVLAAGPGYFASIPTRERDEKRGEVLSTRVERLWVPTEVKAGDRVLVEHLAGDRVKDPDAKGDQRIVRESEIAAVIPEGAQVL